MDEVGVFKKYEKGEKVNLNQICVDLIKFEQNTDRCMRALRRDVMTNAKSIQNITGEINTSFQTIQTRMDSLAELIHKNPSTDPLHAFNRNTLFNEKGPGSSQQTIPKTFGLGGLFKNPQENRPPNFADFNANDSQVNETIQTTEELSDSDEGELNVLTESSSPIPTFNGESHLSFQLWARKFRDFVAANSKWSEGEKIARLKLHLEGIPRQILEDLEDAKKNNLETALDSLAAEIDSPQRKDLWWP